MLCGSWLGIALNNVRSRRRESSLNDGTVENDAKCVPTTTSMLNRSYPSVFDGSQFTPMQPANYVETPPNPCSATGRLRTAIVGPRTISREYDEEFPVYSNDVANRMSRSLYENGCDFGYNQPTPKRRDRSTGPYRHSLQGLDGSGGLYQFCNSSTGECSAYGIEMYSSDSRQSRPCELHLPLSSADVNNESSVVPTKSPNTPNTRLPLSNCISYQYTPTVDKRSVVPNSGSKKVIVAPQPHCRGHNNDSCENPFRNTSDLQLAHRRRVSGGVTSSFPLQYEGRPNYTRDVLATVAPMSDSRSLSYDDRNVRARSGNDIRVSSLEKRVRELEAAMTNSSGQLPNSSPSASTSFIVPVNAKNPQLIVSSVSSAATQQLMAQEIADKEVEIERLQSQLRQCYSRMEIREIQFDEELDKFRKESQDAKAQLEKVKSRLNELEVECAQYRERATYVEAARSSAISSSLEKISAQEKELSRLRSEVEHLSGLSTEVEKIKGELQKSETLNAELRSVVEAKERTMRDLEDSIFAMKLESSCKVSSGSATPCEDARSLTDIELPQYIGGFKELIELKEITPKANGRRASSCTYSSRLKKSRSTQQLSSSNEKFILSPIFSAVIRKQLASTVECRLLAKCLRDTASKALNGDLPSVSRLLGCRSESMSESEVDSLPTDSSPISLIAAERYIKKGAEDLQRIENDLNCLREKFVEYYEKKVVEDLQENDMCRLQ